MQQSQQIPVCFLHLFIQFLRTSKASLLYLYFWFLHLFSSLFALPGAFCLEYSPKHNVHFLPNTTHISITTIVAAGKILDRIDYGHEQYILGKQRTL
jgi:hypothetical protein